MQYSIIVPATDHLLHRRAQEDGMFLHNAMDTGEWKQIYEKKRRVLTICAVMDPRTSHRGG